MCSFLFRRLFAGLGVACGLASAAVLADEPKPKPENTIAVRLAEPVKPQTFLRPLKFFVADLVDRSGNPQPMLVYRPRGGVFLDQAPLRIIRDGLESCLKAAEMLASDQDSADFLLTVYVFHFGLSSSSGLDFFGKVELAAMVKNPKTGKSKQITAAGTSIAGPAILKKNIMKNVQDNIERAFADALRNLLRGAQLRDAAAALDAPSEPAAPPAKATPPQSKMLSMRRGKESQDRTPHGR